MRKFSEQFIQQVAQATDIVDLVSQYVSLKKAGREFVGLCPFHEDHKPSMYVVPAKQIFHCFVCQKGGGVFQWQMAYERQTFPEAVKALAERAHIPLPRDADESPVRPGMGQGDLHAVMAWAADFYHKQLFSPSGAGALEYARKRGLTDESIERFGLGYSPAFWDALLREAAREGITEAQLLAAGLVIQRDAESSSGRSGCYDRFRNRLMFPILDVSGKTIAFGGRALAADERAKYLNSPDSTLFDKSNQLYALNWSREGISSSEQAVVVEGYLDVLLPLQAGLNNVVATLGTALTDRHVRMLSRYAREVVLLYDSDAAGRAAAQRGLEMFLTQQLHVRVASVPEGKDPCDLVVARGGEALKQVITEAPDALQYVWDRRMKRYQEAGGNLADRRKVVEEFLQLVVSSSVYGSIDEIRRGQLAQHIGHILNLSAGQLQEQMRRLARTIPRASAPLQRQAGAREQVLSAPSQAEPASMAQRHALEVLLNCPEWFDHAAEKIGLDDFTQEDLRAVAACMWQVAHDGRLPTLDEVLPREQVSHLGGLIAQLASDGERRGNFEATLQGAIEHLEYARGNLQAEQLKSNGLTDDTLRELENRLKRPDVRRQPKIR